jgi:hypothetical protein
MSVIIRVTDDVISLNCEQNEDNVVVAGCSTYNGPTAILLVWPILSTSEVSVSHISFTWNQMQKNE